MRNVLFKIIGIGVFMTSCVAVSENRAERYAEEGDYKKAVIEYNKLIEKNPKPSYYFERAMARIEKGDFKKAERDLSVVIYNEFQPLGLAYLQRGKVKVAREKMDEAFADFQTCVELDTTKSICYMEWAEGLVKLKKWDEAMEKLDLAWERDSGYWEIPFKKGYVKQLEGDFQSALEYYNYTEDITGRNVYVYFNRGYVLKALDDLKGACVNWKAGCMMSHSENCEEYNKFCRGK